MSVTVVARKDFEDAARSKMLWAITALFVLATAGGMYAIGSFNDDFTANQTVAFLSTPATLIVPLAALVVAYLAIAGERESGSIKLLLGLPHSRRDVLFGKLLGRTAVVSVATVVAFIAGAIVLAVQYGSFPITEFLVQGVVTLLFGLVFVGIAVGFSSMTATRSRAMAGAIGLYFLFQLVWSAVPLGAYYLLEGGIPNPAEGLPAWYFLLQLLNPVNAYAIVADFLTNPDGQTIYQTMVAGDAPFYLEGWFAVVILAVWFVVPLAIGYLSFERADLG
ncbi:ABC-2 type transport system permease protein [Haladaptatus litoreus]|uniref:ABC-2 type transport system permease protein n=1 Tax=Haladaptatus litoreus TaxID=553468 RepID=A0A1N6VS98_9EURY|nr:ABC transporter permease [Haladaptatus litoreus]SIQ80648.1 ABC-2 type transport system permease protein [Haladaptatus litoreus]